MHEVLPGTGHQVLQDTAAGVIVGIRPTVVACCSHASKSPPISRTCPNHAEISSPGRNPFRLQLAQTLDPVQIVKSELPIKAQISLK